MKHGVALGVAFASVAFATHARAVERENQVGFDAGGSLLVIGNKSTPDLGATLGGHYTYGLSDAFNLLAEGTFSLLALDQKADDPKNSHTYPSWLANADVGVAYVFDVLQWVPYVGVLVGGYALSGGTISGTKVLPGAAATLGLDYRFSPSLSVGAMLEEHLLSETSTYPSFTQALTRIEYTWGW
jgi:hypothetical protein